MSRAILGAIVVGNGDAPPGWCAVERDDSPDDENVTRLASDEVAARLVVDRGGEPGSACHYAPAAGLMMLVDEEDVGSEAWAVLDDARRRLARLRHPDPEVDVDAPPKWIVMVPAKLARAAGLISLDELREALRDWT